MSAGSAYPVRAGEALGALRARAPRVHCITSSAAQNFTANVLLALGAQPSLTIAPREIGAFVAGADALLVNLGTLDEERREAISRALEVCERDDLPWVLDPVLVNRSPSRADLALELLGGGPAILRANASEIETLLGLAGHDTPDAAARALGVAVVRTGARDRVCDGRAAVTLSNGDAMMARVTTLGCAGSAVMAAFCAVEENRVLAAVCALAVMGIAGETAAELCAGPGTFAAHFLDAIYRIDALVLKQRMKLEV